jgi:enoyl-CoA hydratase/carnithine racemase
MNGEQHELLTQNQDSELWLTFNRPHKANALSLPLLAGLAMSLGEASTRNDVKAVVLTGVGERTFSAGADLSRPLDNADAYVAQRRAQFAATLLALLDFSKPLVAAVNGAAAGAGMMIPLLCDAVVAADTARFSLPEINKGLPALPGIAIVKDRFGSALASALILSGRWMHAAEALSRGVVNAVVAPAQLRETAQKTALALSAFAGPAYAADKELLNRDLKTALTSALAASARFHAVDKP